MPTAIVRVMAGIHTLDVHYLEYRYRHTAVEYTLQHYTSGAYMYMEAVHF